MTGPDPGRFRAAHHLGLRIRPLAAEIAKNMGLPRRDVYARALALEAASDAGTGEAAS